MIPKINKTRYKWKLKFLNSSFKSLDFVYNNNIIRIDKILVGNAVIMAEIILFVFKK